MDRAKRPADVIVPTSMLPDSRVRCVEQRTVERVQHTEAELEVGLSNPPEL
jgi:hypothetical protein